MTYWTTDPYGTLEFVIGDTENFYCLDYQFSDDLSAVRLHSVINSETAGFIQDAFTGEVDLENAIQTAEWLVDDALDWLVQPDDVVTHDAVGWNQDPNYFVRSVREHVESIRERRAARPVERRVES
jgi:hypothetical protein